MRIDLDGREMTDRKRAHAYLASQLQFPQYYGRNLDALYDLLTECAEEMEIRLHNVEKMKEQLGIYGNKLLQTLLEAETDHESLTVTVCSEAESEIFFEKSKNNT